MQKKKYLVIDTETAKGFAQPLCYDIGYAVVDNTGLIYYSNQYLVNEIFDNNNLMETAFYASKIPQYKASDIKHAFFVDIWKDIQTAMQVYNVTTVCAYNTQFDIRALNCTAEYVTRGFIKSFFIDTVEYYDIWNMCCNTLFQTKDYLQFAFDNGLETDKGNMQTNAEVAYKYITKDTDFVESHTALDDVLIESQVMAYVLPKTKCKYRGIKAFCWKLPQEKYKKYKIKCGEMN